MRLFSRNRHCNFEGFEPKKLKKKSKGFSLGLESDFNRMVNFLTSDSREATRYFSRNAHCNPIDGGGEFFRKELLKVE